MDPLQGNLILGIFREEIQGAVAELTSYGDRRLADHAQNSRFPLDQRQRIKGHLIQKWAGNRAFLPQEEGLTGRGIPTCR